MRIVAIDTTGSFGSIALYENESILEEVPLYSPDGFSQTIFDSIRRLLARHEVDIQPIDCFASANGPGSFTGLRIGLTVAKGLAESTGAKAIGVSSLQALACCGTSATRGVVIDARRSEIYAAVYDSQLELCSPEVVTSAIEWTRSLLTFPDEILSNDLNAIRSLLPPSIPASEHRIIASSIAQIAARRIHAGDPGDPAAIDADYVRRSDAERLWRA